jgi:imidazolonepropionase-like amidohydrolase
VILPPIFAFALLGGVAPQPACDASPLVIRDTTVWTRDGLLPKRDVVIQDGRVSAIRPTGQPPPAGARTIDGAGQTLLPGLVDAHLHFVIPGGLPAGAPADRQAAVTGRQLLSAGVTAGRLHLAPIDQAVALKARGADSCAPVPRLSAGGPLIGGAMPADYAQAWGVKDVADVEAKVARIAAAGLDWIAIHDADRFAPGLLEAGAAAARRRGLKLLGAGTRPTEIEALLRIRPDTLDYFDRSDSAEYAAALLEAIRGQRGLILAPTFGIHHRVAGYAAQPARLDDAGNTTFLDAADRAFVLEAARKELAGEAAKRGMPSLPRKAAQLRALGLPLAIASDVGSPLHFQGDGIWWELEAWRALGFSHREALRAATEGGGRVLGVDDIGRLAVGSRGDFVLYRGNVEDGPFDAARVAAVGKGGVLFVNGGRWTGPETPAR